MLKAVTKKVIDRSTDKFFKFEFYCDRCGKKLTSKPYYFEHSFPDRLTDGEKKAKEIMWRVEHDIAFERANLEVRLKFNECNSCGNIVCDECLSLNEDEDLCVDCEQNKRK